MSALKNPNSYEFSEDFLNETEEAVRPRVRSFEPGQAAREQLILNKLGINGWGRWQYFRSCFSDGWGEAEQRPLSPRSQEMFFEALNLLRIPEGVRASVFLTDEGHMELAWKDAEGRAAQIEFGPREFEVYNEATGADATFTYDLLPGVIEKYFGV